MDSTYLQGRIDATKLIIEKYEDAILFLSTNPTKSFTLDTGQSSQQVSYQNLENLNMVLDSLYNRLCTFEARLTGSGVTRVQPAW